MLGQRLQVLRPFDDGDLGIELAARHAARRIEQAHHRGHHLVGEPQAHPDRGEQEDDADERIHHAEGDLHAQPLRHQRVIFLLGFARLLQLVQHRGIDDAVDHQIGIGEVLQLDQRTDDIAAPARLDHHQLALVGAREIGLARREELDPLIGDDAGLEFLLAVLALGGIEDEDGRKAMQCRMARDAAEEGRRDRSRTASRCWDRSVEICTTSLRTASAWSRT